jgi:hypothetical protein
MIVGNAEGLYPGRPNETGISRENRGAPSPIPDLDAPIQGVAPWKGGFANYMIH